MRILRFPRFFEPTKTTIVATSSEIMSSEISSLRESALHILQVEFEQTLELEHQARHGVDTCTDHVRSASSQTSCNHGDVLLHTGIYGRWTWHQPRTASMKMTMGDSQSSMTSSSSRTAPGCFTDPPSAIFLAITTNKSNPASLAFSLTSFVPSTASDSNSGIRCSLSLGRAVTKAESRRSRSYLFISHQIERWKRQTYSLRAGTDSPSDFVQFGNKLLKPLSRGSLA